MATSPEDPDPSLPDDVSDKIGQQLQLTLVELIALSLTGKQLHWNAYGREFLSAHRHLDLVVEGWRELEVAVAERAATVGIPPDASAPAVVELAKLWEVALRVRQRSELLGTLDGAAQDVLVDVGRTLEEQGWMMWAQLPDYGHRLIVSSPPNVTG